MFFIVVFHTFSWCLLVTLLAQFKPVLKSPWLALLSLFSPSFFFHLRYHCHTLPPVSLRAVETVTQSKVLWTGTPVPSCQPTNCQVSGTLPTPTEGNTVATTLLHTRSKVCRHRVRDKKVTENDCEPLIVRNINIFLESEMNWWPIGSLHEH